MFLVNTGKKHFKLGWFKADSPIINLTVEEPAEIKPLNINYQESNMTVHYRPLTHEYIFDLDHQGYNYRVTIVTELVEQILTKDVDGWRMLAEAVDAALYSMFAEDMPSKEVARTVAECAVLLSIDTGEFITALEKTALAAEKCTESLGKLMKAQENAKQTLKKGGHIFTSSVGFENTGWKNSVFDFSKEPLINVEYAEQPKYHSPQSLSFGLPGAKEKVMHPVPKYYVTAWKFLTKEEKQKTTWEEFKQRKITLRTVIMDLNDVQKWSREQIADWLESLDIDITFKVPEMEETNV